MEITIKNFTKYNPRKELKSMPWFRVDSNFFDTPEFYNESALTRNLFVTLVGLCAQKVKDTINYDLDFICAKSNMEKSQVLESLEKLEQKQILAILNTDTIESDRIGSKTCYTNERTNEHNSAIAHDHDRPPKPKPKGKTKQKYNEDLIQRVIAQLNKHAVKNYKSETLATKKVIQARINEGYKFEDFAHVIDVKSDEWFHDSKMNQFLRPSTLFGNKFESYLQQEGMSKADILSMALKSAEL